MSIFLFFYDFIKICKCHFAEAYENTFYAVFIILKHDIGMTVVICALNRSIQEAEVSGGFLSV